MRKSLVPSLGLIAALAVSACAPSSSGNSAGPNNAVVRVTDSAMTMKVDTSVVPAGKGTFLVFHQEVVVHQVVILKTDKDASQDAPLPGASKGDQDSAGENS